MTLLFSAPASSQPFIILAALHTWIFLGSTGQLDLFFFFVISIMFIFLPFWYGLARLWWPLSSIFAKSFIIPLLTSYLDCWCLLVSFKIMARLCFLFCLLFRRVFRVLQEYKISLYIHLEMRNLQLYPQECPSTSRT